MSLPTCPVCGEKTGRYHVEEGKKICHSCWSLQQPDHVICLECGAAEQPTSYFADVAEKLRERQLCHSCGFWTDFAKKVSPAEISGLELLASGELSPEEHEAAQQTLQQLGGVEIDPTIVRIDGKHYEIGPEFPANVDKQLCGFGGAKFIISFFDGRRVDGSSQVKTTNLWSQGEIPEHFRERLPDNAEFLPDPEKERQREVILAGLRRDFREVSVDEFCAETGRTYLRLLTVLAR